jgi:hypothetical protein
MSTPFYDLASLVLVPSGYKAQKVYAQKPLTTDGQLTFSRASTATRVNASGLIESVASGVPRLDYQGSTCPKLLLEPQRTNAQTYSEDFSQAKYTKTDCTISTNVTATNDPSGTTNSDKLVEAVTTGGQHYIYFSAQTGANQETQISIFAKAAERTEFLLWESAITNAQARFNLSNGTIAASSSGNASNLVTTVPTITNYGNGWYRCTLNFKTASGGGTVRVQLYNGSTSYNGNGTSGIYLWGLQEEVNVSYATSYIPTTSAAVTRLADAASKTGISSLIGQTEGTIYTEIDYININSNNVGVIAQITGTINAAIFRIGLDIYGSAAGSVLFSYPQTTFGKLKIAFAYKSGNSALYVNGVQKATSSTSLTFGSFSNLYLGNNSGGSEKESLPISQALLFTTRLTNAQLAELTTL